MPAHAPDYYPRAIVVEDTQLRLWFDKGPCMVCLLETGHIVVDVAVVGDVAPLSRHCEAWAAAT